MTVIKDGTGTGALARVNEDGQIFTRTVSESLDIYIGREHGDYYAVSTFTNTLNSINEHIMIYLQNNNPTKLLCVVVHIYGWNGGNTNHNRSMLFKFYKNPPAPTANNTLVEPGNVNYTSGNLSGTICYVWNGVGDGMTSAAISPLTSQIVGVGLSQLWTNGTPILGFGQSLSLSVTAEEIGNASVVIRFFMVDKESNS